MFENYRELNEAEKASVKSIHKAVRALRKSEGRYGALAWAFVRGFKYRRVERSHHVQKDTGYEHNMPSGQLVTHLLGKAIPGFAETGEKWWHTKEHADVRAWLADPSGAIPAPTPRAKKPFEAKAAE